MSCHSIFVRTSQAILDDSQGTVSRNSDHMQFGDHVVFCLIIGTESPIRRVIIRTSENRIKVNLIILPK